MIMDSLRYWVTEMHVDGFRFDLAAALARQFHEMDRLSAFFDMCQQDPIVSQVKLIAEPWDVARAATRSGTFPPLWTEWNGSTGHGARFLARRTRHAARVRLPADRLQRLVPQRRPPAGGLGSTSSRPRRLHLADLVSYNHKHNEANGEAGRDGSDDNRSWNCGAGRTHG